MNKCVPKTRDLSRPYTIKSAVIFLHADEDAGAPKSNPGGIVALYIQWHILKQPLSPFSVIELLALNERDKAFCFNYSKMICQDFHFVK